MAKVDPFVIQWPVKWLSDAEIRPVIEYLNRFLHDLYIRTGGGTDAIAEAGDTIISNIISSTYTSSPSSLPLFSKGFNTVSQVAGEYTAVPFDFINATLGAKIIFPKYPDENNVIIIRNGDGTKIPFDGNGKPVNGSDNGALTKKGTAIEFHYFLDSDEWFAR